ncbi:MAG: DUF3524 domain-containing protein [Gammaproteobacteria bacterium]|nr:DUF3524 domain-containing protein [Gammaproteobacteria bacterium]MCW8909462.1 DUF3524 domain-containing protein [Gammaproteobacteria bacterium]MCW9055029.1 DUF3524 domain-containing protein [Gammaproteobacteria bacterium]
MHILALNPYHGGSHKAFIDGWINHSRHDWTLLTLPPHHWKWRMRHAAISFIEQISQITEHKWDIIVCTDMLNLAEFTGLAPPSIQKLPKVIYFHENQLLYPDLHSTERDCHYAFTNFISALSADEIWFNSDWHKNTFTDALKQWLSKMPDYQPTKAIEKFIKKSKTHYPGIETDCYQQAPQAKQTDDLTILWAARWENDKNPECFFRAIDLLIQKGINFKLNILGSSSNKTPLLFEQAKQRLTSYINNWGYIDDRNEYLEILKTSNIIVSTAAHEFFGIAVLEAVSLGCIPVVPQHLAYPETLSKFRDKTLNSFYNGSAQHLAEKIEQLSHKIKDDDWIADYRNKTRSATSRYQWNKRSEEMDNDLSTLITNHCPE